MSWQELADGISESRRAGFLALETPVAIACELVEALRRARARGAWAFTGRQAAVGLLFAGVRMLALHGASREDVERLVDVFWKLNAPR